MAAWGYLGRYLYCRGREYTQLVSRPFSFHHGMMNHAHSDAPRDRRLLADLLLTRLQVGHFLTGRGRPAAVARA